MPQFTGQGSNKGPRHGSDPKRIQQMDTFNTNRCWGSETNRTDVTNLGNMHPLLDRPRSTDDIVSCAIRDNGPSHWRLRDPSSLDGCLLRRRPPPNNRHLRPCCHSPMQKAIQLPSGSKAAATHRFGARIGSHGYGRGCFGRDQTS